jgi:hypothetical protein
MTLSSVLFLKNSKTDKSSTIYCTVQKVFTNLVQKVYPCCCKCPLNCEWPFLRAAEHVWFCPKHRFNFLYTFLFYFLIISLITCPKLIASNWPFWPRSGSTLYCDPCLELIDWKRFCVVEKGFWSPYLIQSTSLSRFKLMRVTSSENAQLMSPDVPCSNV